MVNYNNILEEYIKNKEYEKAVSLCYQNNDVNFALILSMASGVFTKQNIPIVQQTNTDHAKPQIDNTKLDMVEHSTPTKRVLVYCSWTSSEDLCKVWNKMSKGNCSWEHIQLVSTEPADYYVVVNCPPISIVPNPKKTIVFQMEPNMHLHKHMWGEWSEPDIKDHFDVISPIYNKMNNLEWHISKTYNELMTSNYAQEKQYDKIVSSVLSDKYTDIGQMKRIDFAKELEKHIPLHVYGSNKFLWKTYKGNLPYHEKDNALIPYKYTFNAENNSIPYYVTEKLVDGILSECLVFYWGAPNIKNMIDERAYVLLDLDDINKSIQIVRLALEEDWWSKRIEYIREAKKKILTELQFFPRLASMIPV